MGQQLIINQITKKKKAELAAKKKAVPVNKNAEKFKNGKKKSR